MGIRRQSVKIARSRIGEHYDVNPDIAKLLDSDDVTGHIFCHLDRDAKAHLSRRGTYQFAEEETKKRTESYRKC